MILNYLLLIILIHLFKKKIRHEWKKLAHVLDRLFLIIMTISFIMSSTSIIMFQTPFLKYDEFLNEKVKTCN